MCPCVLYSSVNVNPTRRPLTVRLTRTVVGFAFGLHGVTVTAQMRNELVGQSATVQAAVIQSAADSSLRANSVDNRVRPRPSVPFSEWRRPTVQSPLSLATIRTVDSKAPAPWYGPLASLVVPGTGQALFRQQRSVAYMVAEGFLAIRAVRAYRDRNAARSQYQKLAADVARSGFGTDKPVGPWDYYETLEKYTASGAYDLAVGGKFTPESDMDTYNGEVWFIARRIFWASPDSAPAELSAEYQRALSRYKEIAVRDNFRWSWKDQTNVQNEYILSISEANRSKQRMVSTFGLLAVNHLASFVDGYITVRLRKYGGAGLVGATVRTEVRPTGGVGENAYGAAMTVSVPIGNGGRNW